MFLPLQNALFDPSHSSRFLGFIWGKVSMFASRGEATHYHRSTNWEIKRSDLILPLIPGVALSKSFNLIVLSLYDFRCGWKGIGLSKKTWFIFSVFHYKKCVMTFRTTQYIVLYLLGLVNFSFKCNAFVLNSQPFFCNPWPFLMGNLEIGTTTSLLFLGSAELTISIRVIQGRLRSWPKKRLWLVHIGEKRD